MNGKYGRKPLQRHNKPEPEARTASYVIGRNAVSELLKSGRDIDKIYIKKGERTGSVTVIAAEAIKRGIPVIDAENSKLDFMACGQPHQGVVASAAVKDYATVDDMLKLAEDRGEKPLIVIADGIEDPRTSVRL